MVATGCNSVNPKIPGADSPAVFYLKTMEDGLLLHEILRLRDVTRVAVVGGGYIGLEMAEALLHLGKDVTLIEAGPRLLASFEPEFSELAAQELRKTACACAWAAVCRKSPTVAASASCAPVRRLPLRYDPHVRGRSSGDGFSARYGHPHGAQRRDTRGSRDAHVAEHIYAAGDCAVVYHRLMDEDYFIPLGTYANKCGRIAGGNMAGAHEKFVGALGTAAIKVCGLEMGRTGMSEKGRGAVGHRLQHEARHGQRSPRVLPRPPPNWSSNSSMIPALAVFWVPAWQAKRAR